MCLRAICFILELGSSAFGEIYGLIRVVERKYTTTMSTMLMLVSTAMMVTLINMAVLGKQYVRFIFFAQYIHKLDFLTGSFNQSP